MRKHTDTCEAFHGLAPHQQSPLPPNSCTVAIVGATATGKTDLALELAERLGGEIVCIDKKTARRGMRIGTAAPTPAQQARVPHHLLEVLYIEDASAAPWIFRNMAQACQQDIITRGKLPVLVGGSVHLMESLVYDLVPRGETRVRTRLESLSNHQLIGFCQNWPNIGLPFELDRRRLINHIVTRLAYRVDAHTPLRYGCLVLGTYTSPAELETRIRTRTSQMMANGLANEVAQILEACHGFWPEEAKTTIGYSDFHPSINRGLTPEESIVRRTLALARWQDQEIRRRIPDVQWVDSLDEALDRYHQHTVRLISPNPVAE